MLWMYNVPPPYPTLSFFTTSFEVWPLLRSLNPLFLTGTLTLHYLFLRPHILAFDFSSSAFSFYGFHSTPETSPKLFPSFNNPAFLRDF